MRRVLLMDGGLIQGIMVDDDVEILVMDFDTEGARLLREEQEGAK